MPDFEAWTLNSALAAARSDEERARWRAIRALPHLLAVDGDGVCPDVELSIIAHTILDDGMDFCVPCDQLVRGGRFCGICGRTLGGGSAGTASRPQRRCPDDHCQHETRSTYCESCGARVVPVDIERVEKGETTIGQLAREAQAAYRAWQARQKPEPPLERERRRLYRDGPQ